MGQGDITVWTNFIREETEVVINQLEEDLVVRGDPDDPFNGAANGVFQQLQNNLPLPPPVRMPRRQEDIGELSEHSQKSPKDTEKSKQEDVKMKETLNTWRMQGVRCESSKHSLVSPDPMRSIQNLHTVFTPGITPLQGQQEAAQSATERQEKPKKQRSSRRRKVNSEWQLIQRLFEQNKAQEISHIAPDGQVSVFNTEEPSISYLQLPTRAAQENNRVCTKCGETGHWKRYCRMTTWCKFCISETHATQPCRKYANFVRDNPIASSRRTTWIQEQRRIEPPQANIQILQQHQYGVDQGQRQLFPHPPTQRFQAPQISPMGSKQIQL